MFENITGDILDYAFLGSSVASWLTMLAVWAGTAMAILLVRKVLVWRLAKMAERTTYIVDDVLVSVIKATKFYFIIAFALYVAVTVAPVGATLSLYIARVAFLLLLLQGITWGNHLITAWLAAYRERMLETDAAAVTTMQAVGFVGRLLLYTIILLLALDNFGVDVTALVAGLGIGGVAIALALQNVLGDLFASLAIVLDKPFVVGDFLNLGEYVGTVEQIGLKTTRIRSLSGEQIIISNGDLLSSRIRNYKRMFERRILFSFGVLYETPKEQVAEIPSVVREIIESLDDTRFDRAHFNAFGDSSLDFEVVYFVLVPEYNTYMDRQQAINLALLERFEQMGVDFAYPTRTIIISGADGENVEATAAGGVAESSGS